MCVYSVENKKAISIVDWGGDCYRVEYAGDNKVGVVWEDRKEDMIEYADTLYKFVEDNQNLLYRSFVGCLTNFDMKIICNAYQVANNIIDWYSPFLSKEEIKGGINQFLDIVKNNKDCTHFQSGIEQKEEFFKKVENLLYN